MLPVSEKIYLQLMPPSEDAPVSDQQRIRLALQELGYENITFPLPVLGKLYPLCRKADGITVTLVYRETDWVITDIQAGDRRQQHYALAVDYGSTTVVMRLVDMNSGAVVAEEKTVNGQAVYGSDILTRITYSLEGEKQVQDLQRATVETFQDLLAKLSEDTGIDAARCPVMAVAGNTTMIHFLLKLNAWTVFASPFAPVCSDPGFVWGRELGLDFQGLVYLFPAASNYIGGDIISGLTVLAIHKKAETSLFFDIGTNGELVIGNRDWMLAGAGAAGPALEGYISRFGMRAQKGAIDSVTIRNDALSFTTIGKEPPVGICGSGIIDLIAQMRLNGWIDAAGQLNPDTSDRIVFLEDEQEFAAVYADATESATGSPLYFSQTDIHQYLDTKAAAYTMVDCLLETAGVHAEELAQVYLSGAFPAHSDLESAITVGIFPDLPRERYHCIANTSLEGAQLLLLDRTKLSEARELAEQLYCVQFASIPDFLIRMQAAKFIPHTDKERYPTVQKRLQTKENYR
ncbi:MAG: DUF4445 domain-containing protein [Oscillospiraceae bacterium]|nr:DUF4445 domain-containing protein [Oscillospiraceae bacterium]